jgi:type II restriction/modification system DNA methylase subunit YeeA
MPLSWNEIKTRATAFSKERENTEREEAEAKEFLVAFLNVFGITRRRVATFEHKVKKLNTADGYIDLLWKGMILVEMKSSGKNLDEAYKQAKEYCHGLKEYELPKLIMVCDFHRFQVYDENGNQTNFTLPELIKNAQLFAAIAGYEKRTYKEQDPVNIKAAELMGKLHDKLKAIGYDGHHLELYLVRLLFCLFADDTSIFDRGIFQDYIELKTNEDGSDLAAHISQIFQILNTHEDKRLKNIDEALNAFPYVNGKLFEEALPMASYDSEMRNVLLQSCWLDWGKISPAIFGSLFQSVMDEKARRNLGAHYTSEKNILKLIKPLFLDELTAEYTSSKNDNRKLQKLHNKISKLRFLDPACGCGNFLIIAYRELRILELDIVKSLLKGQQVTSINDYFLVDVDQFYGIEYEEFPSQIAQVAMWLIDHQMNEAASLEFGEYYKRIPLKKSATIVCGNALQIDWQSLLQKDSTVNVYADTTNIFMVNEPGEVYKTLNVYTKQVNRNPEKPAAVTNLRYHYILGNPPFIGAKWMNEYQRNDIELVAGNINNFGLLDYVTGWYIKSCHYLENSPETKVAFVSTNSITQGEQVYPLWTYLFGKSIIIHFAYRTFSWSNEAKGNAAVHCVIIGFAKFNIPQKKIFIQDLTDTIEIEAQNINPYLINAKSILIPNRSKPICNVKEIATGNKPIDNGEFIFTEEQYKAFIFRSRRIY